MLMALTVIGVPTLQGGTRVTVEPPPPAATPPPDPPLIAAIKANGYSWSEAPKFKALMLREGANGPKDALGRSPLHWGVMQDWRDYSLLMLLNGAEVDTEDATGATPLFYAARKGLKEMVQLLVLRGADVNHRSKEGRTPLTEAITGGQEELTEMLLWLGAAPQLTGVPDEQQPLALAKEKGHALILQTVQDYLDGYATQAKYGRVPQFVKNSLHEAARLADFHKLDQFLNAGANIDTPDENGKTPLVKAISAAQSDVIFYLLARGANPNIADKSGFTPLMATMGWLGSSFDQDRRCLIARGANPFALRLNGHNELTWAVERDNGHGVQWLLLLGAKGRELTRVGTPYQVAFNAGRQGIMDLLKRNGIEEPVQLSDDPVWNLHNGVRRGDIALIEQCLAEGVPVDAPDKDGQSPLVMAIATRHEEVADLLIKYGADLNYRNPKTDVTPIYMTMIWDYGGMTDFRKRLLESKVDLEVGIGSKGETALMRGVWHNPTTPLKQLIDAGANLNTRDKRGITALGYAIEKGYWKTADYLRELGATE